MNSENIKGYRPYRWIFNLQHGGLVVSTHCICAWAVKTLQRSPRHLENPHLSWSLSQLIANPQKCSWELRWTMPSVEPTAKQHGCCKRLTWNGHLSVTWSFVCQCWQSLWCWYRPTDGMSLQANIWIQRFKDCYLYWDGMFKVQSSISIIFALKIE